MGNQSSSGSGSGHGLGHSVRSRASSSSAAAAATTVVNGGSVEPQSHIYASTQPDYTREIVHKLVIDQRLAPFYLGLQDFEEDWTIDEIVTAIAEADAQATANLKKASQQAQHAVNEAQATASLPSLSARKAKEAQAAVHAATVHRDHLAEILKLRDKYGSVSSHTNLLPELAKLYHAKAVECPICFLYYPPNMVRTRCCDQPICTECFVQIKRTEPTVTHLESEPAACPFCTETNFGCTYVKPKPSSPLARNAVAAGSSAVETEEVDDSAQPRTRRKSFAHTEASVVTSDHIRPDWEAKLEAIKATAARRANRRVVFRQVGDRLIPVGITSGRESDGPNATMATQALPPGLAAQIAAALSMAEGGHGSGSGGGESGRSSRRRPTELQRYIESLGAGPGQDIEEMMIMEAMRLSLADEEERRAREASSTSAQGQAQGQTGPSTPTTAASPPSPPTPASATTTNTTASTPASPARPQA